MMNDAAPLLVLGAGPAGIGAAMTLEDNALLLEKSDSVGGLSRSYTIGEAVFDLGGHSFHTPHPFVRQLVFDTLPMYEQQRDARCFFRGELIAYPFQKNFTALSDRTVVEQCAAGLEQADASQPGSNFAEYIANRFGDGIAEHFMLPYNRKLWARDLAQLDTSWVGQRVAAPAGIQEEFEQRGGQRRPLQANTSVAYPAEGGFGRIFEQLAWRVKRCQFNTQISSIRLAQKRASTADGRHFAYDKLISTLPLPLLLRLADPVPAELVERADRLEAMSLKCVMIAINHPVDTGIQRIYCAHDDIPAHKIAINHNSSDWLRRRRHHGVIGEVSYSQHKPVDERTLAADFVTSLLKLGIIQSRDEVLAEKIVDVPRAYPVPTHERSAIIQEAEHYLQQYDVHLAGRFAQWAYINSDEALARGLILGRQLRAGVPA